MDRFSVSLVFCSCTFRLPGRFVKQIQRPRLLGRVVLLLSKRGVYRPFLNSRFFRLACPGYIPKELGVMSRLLYLRLDHNHLMGEAERRGGSGNRKRWQGIGLHGRGLLFFAGRFRAATYNCYPPRVVWLSLAVASLMIA